MEPKTKEESEIYSQMLTMLADQFYHQPGENITINRMVLADMLTKQTMHGIELHCEAEAQHDMGGEEQEFHAPTP